MTVLANAQLILPDRVMRGALHFDGERIAAITEGDAVSQGQVVAVVEAMKMEQPLLAHRDGVISALGMEAGLGVSAGQVLCEIVDA